MWGELRGSFGNFLIGWVLKSFCYKCFFEVFLKCLVFCKGFGKGRVFVYKNVVRKKVFILLLDELFFLLEENIEILNFK